ncbi:MAG: energy transducer TonB [Lentimicrobium sp.]|jgi:TonB family protein|nr:energy transducer TonB [Lentimicrobium sp.]
MNRKILLLLSLVLSLNSLWAQDVVPSTPAGGKSQLKYFIDQELIFPEADLKAKTEGNCQIKYHINEKGQVSKVILLNSVSPQCDQETVRIFNMIEWEPATKIGIPVADSGIFEIEFNPKKYTKLCRKRGYTFHLYPYEPVDTSGVINYYRNLDKMPSPIFTTPAINLAGYIAANLKYPEAAIKQNLSGNVKLGFVVEPHGKISNLMILNSLGAGCNEEAIRLVRLIKWMPGIKNDLAVRTRMSISINFSLESGPEGNFNPNIKSSYGGY